MIKCNTTSCTGFNFHLFVCPHEKSILHNNSSTDGSIKTLPDRLTKDQRHLSLSTLLSALSQSTNFTIVVKLNLGFVLQRGVIPRNDPYLHFYIFGVGPKHIESPRCNVNMPCLQNSRFPNKKLIFGPKYQNLGVKI